MHPDTEESIAQIVRKFRWVDSNRIRIINDEAIEKIVDISNGFQELNFGAVPFLDMSKFLELKGLEKFHYYFES